MEKFRKEISLTHYELKGLQALADNDERSLKKYIELVLIKHLKENKLG